MTENISAASIKNTSFNDYEWRNFNVLHVAANAIGAGICIFYFYHFEPTGYFPTFYDAFVIPVIVTISLIMIGMLYQYRWKKSLMVYIHILRKGQAAPLELQKKAQRQILNLPYISAGITLLMWGLASLLMTIFRMLAHPEKEAFSESMKHAVRILGGTVLAGLVTSAVILFTMETLCRKIRPYFFPEGGMVKTIGAYQLKLRIRMLITFFLTSILPLGLMALLSYNKTRMMAFMNPQEVLQSMLNLTMFLVVIGISASVVLSRQFAISIVDPIKDIEKAMTRVENGDLTASVLVRSNDELGAMTENFNKMIDVLRERSRIQKSLNMAMEVQQNLLPKSLPRIRGIDMAGACSYCDETGGDYFDIYVPDLSSPDRFSVVVGDVSDHGVSSALVMTTARALLRMRSSMSGSVAQVVSDVNRQLSRDVEDSGQFMTLFYGELDRASLQLRWVNAGHDPAILFDTHTGQFQELKGKGMALGIFDDADYVQSERGVLPGQALIIGTDGIWEMHNPEGEMFGRDRLKEIIRCYAESSADEIVHNIMNGLEQFRYPLEKEDDVTLVVIKIIHEQTGCAEQKKP
ncbi:MAG: PP2C family protein-serine/threonine phosphatase [Deltaproteobacteria bacterium]|nr:PP2C family protein-serine/threonine phosphatase [Deltaproteobacteria bacterium]